MSLQFQIAPSTPVGLIPMSYWAKLESKYQPTKEELKLISIEITGQPYISQTYTESIFSTIAYVDVMTMTGPTITLGHVLVSLNRNGIQDIALKEFPDINVWKLWKYDFNIPDKMMLTLVAKTCINNSRELKV